MILCSPLRYTHRTAKGHINQTQRPGLSTQFNSSFLILISTPFYLKATPKMRGLTVLLALATPLTVASWTLTWYSDDNCITPLGHIEDSGSRNGNLDSNVDSLIADFDSGEFIFIGSGIFSTTKSGSCKKLPDGENTWNYSA